MTLARFCPQCGAALLPQPEPSVCPRCAFRVALAPAVPRDPPPTQSADLSGPGFVPPKPAELAPSFPQLEILELIGQGGMGAVYKARQKGLDRLVALKILPPEVARDPAFAERFHREGRALARLHHPNIVSIFDSGQAGDRFYYFLMEFVEGVNLRQALLAGKLSPPQALAIVPQLCDALQYAHDERVVHRDIKPENVLLDTRGRVKIADFGLARIVGASPENFTLTGSRQVMGTPRYMAPEQLEGAHAVDHRADIYSLGVVFYEMLTGELPLGRFAPPSRKVQVDVRLDEVVLRTLEKEPALRFQQAGELKTAVQSLATPASSLASRRGGEYRSAATILGIPWVHITSGIDPATGRPRVAKGVIAIGDQAMGVVAIGGLALGVFAVGGVALGAVTLGGASLALAAAVGGGALSCCFALGGFAVAPIAVGGCAVGYYVAGGAGFGIYPYAGNAQTPEGREFFSSGIWRLKDVALGGLAAVSSLLAVLVIIHQAFTRLFPAGRITMDKPTSPVRSAPESFPANQWHAHRHEKSHPSAAVWGCVAAGILTLLLLCGLGILVLIFSWRVTASRRMAEMELQRAREMSEEAALRAAQERARAAGLQAPNLDWLADGPRLSGDAILALQLQQSPELLEKLNRVLHEVHQQYRQIERAHWQRDVSPVRQVTTVRVPRETIQTLESQLWSRLDPLLTPQQQQTLRQKLPLYPVPATKLPLRGALNELCLPGVLGWGSYEATITIHRGGEWFDWEVQCQGQTATGAGRALDGRWARFWSVEGP